MCANLCEVKLFDDPTGEIGKAPESYNYGKSGERGLIEAYLGGKLKLGIRYILTDFPQFGFLISHYVAHTERCALESDIPPIGESSGDHQNREQAFVLSHNVEAMEGEKVPITSLIRFEQFNDLSFSGGEGVYEFVPFVAPGDESFLVSRDRKISIVNKRWAVAIGQSDGQNIQTAANGVDVSPSLDVERERKRLFAENNNVIVRNIQWQLFDSYVQVVVKPALYPLLKGWEMGLGPVD